MRNAGGVLANLSDLDELVVQKNIHRMEEGAGVAQAAQSILVYDRLSMHFDPVHGFAFMFIISLILIVAIFAYLPRPESHSGGDDRAVTNVSLQTSGDDRADTNDLSVSIQMPAEEIVSECTFIRHGTSVWNEMKAKGKSGLNSPYDAPLTKQGKDDAKSTGAALRAQAIWTPQNTAVMVSNLDRAQLTGAIAALEIEDSLDWKLYIMSSMQETSNGFDADSQSAAGAARILSTDNLQDLDGVNTERLQTLYSNAVTAWNKGNHARWARGSYHRHFPKYVSHLKKHNPRLNFLMAGHSHWFQQMVQEYGDESCKTSGDGQGRLNNGEAVRFILKTSMEGGKEIVEIKDCRRIHAGRDLPPRRK